MKYIQQSEAARRNLGAEPGPPGANRMAEGSHDVAADVITRIQIRARMVSRMRAAGMQVTDDEIF
jgi:hypothetical protein